MRLSRLGRRKRKSTRSFEYLESRNLMAGDLSIDLSCAASIDAGIDSGVVYIAGDADRNGIYDPADVQVVLSAAKYETAQPADWSEGDWNGDHAFDNKDVAAAVRGWPDVIAIPTGFESEGIEHGQGHDFFLGGYTWSGDLTNAGAIYKGNVCTGEGSVLVKPTGRPLAGLSYDARTDTIYAAVADPGVFVGHLANHGIIAYDASSGDLIHEFVFGDGIVLNDVLVTQNAVYGTDSIHPSLYKVELDANGQPTGTWNKLDMTGFMMDSAGFGFNANGLVSDFDGDELVVININTGVLYNVDTTSGVATPMPIDGAETLFADGDGLYLDGRTLYIMQNFQHKIAVVQLSEDLSHGTFVKNLVSDQFSVPTTITGIGNSVYAINTHFCELTPLCGLDPEEIDPTRIRSEVVRVDKVDQEIQNGEQLLGDIDGDNEVGFSDFLIVSHHFGDTSAAPTEGDLNEDGNVDFADFLLLAMNFGKKQQPLAP